MARLFQAALDDLRRAGAELVEIPEFGDRQKMRQDEHLILMTELKADLNAYLATTPSAVTTRTLADVIAFNERNAAAELRWFGQDQLIEAEATKGLTIPLMSARGMRRVRWRA